MAEEQRRRIEQDSSCGTGMSDLVFWKVDHIPMYVPTNTYRPIHRKNVVFAILSAISPEVGIVVVHVIP